MLSSSLYQLIMQTDGITKVVLAVLLLLSIVCWAIFFGKFLLYRVKRKDIIQMRKQVQHVKHKDQLRDLVLRSPHSVASYLVGSVLTTYKQVEMGMISPAEWQDDIASLVDNAVVQEELYIPVLTAGATVSPLLGLFGTVWGLIHAFIGISQTHVADIATIAPGIAEALITTLAGLLVAIPALVMSNIALAHVRGLETQLGALVAEVQKIVTVHRTKKEGLCATVSGVVDQQLMQ